MVFLVHSSAFVMPGKKQGESRIVLRCAWRSRPMQYPRPGDLPVCSREFINTILINKTKPNRRISTGLVAGTRQLSNQFIRDLLSLQTVFGVYR
jgi:hypothetical protein